MVRTAIFAEVQNGRPPRWLRERDAEAIDDERWQVEMLQQTEKLMREGERKQQQDVKP